MLGRFDIPQTMDRRRFLQVTALAGGGFVIGFGGWSLAKAGESTGTEGSLNPFIRIAPDDTVTVICKHLDKGQGVTTGLPTIVAEELDADWSQMRAEFAPANADLYKNLAFGIQGTGGSSSIANSWNQLRSAAAAARHMLLQAAANQWGAEAAGLTIEKGTISDGDGNRSGFGALATAAAAIAPPENPRLKDPQDYGLIGTRVPRLDSPAKTDGSAVFTLDIQRPGMLEAVVAHPPRFGATVKSVDDTKARAVPGVTDVVQIPRGVAVLADSYHTALKARGALSIEWDFSQAESRGSDALIEAYSREVEQAGLVARTEGDADGVIENAPQTVSAGFSMPYLAHAAMEPMDCVAELTADGCEIWTGSQLQTVDQMVLGKMLDIPLEKVVIHTQFAGGSFGRRAVPDSDYLAEAVMIAKAIDGRAPVKLHWSREDDMTGGRYRPMSVHRLRGALDENGDISAWHHRTAVQSIFAGTPFASAIQEGIDPSAVEGAANLPYAIPNLQVELHTMQVGVPVLWWRSVGHSQNAFVTEVFLDRLARAGKKDPLAIRRRLLAGHLRHLAVLNLAAEKAGWDRPLEGEGRGRGIAVHESFGSFVAQVAEVTVGDDGAFSVDRVVCAVDCGIAVNPDVVTAQMEGGIAYGLSAALREAVTLKDGEVQQKNFNTYRSLRIDEMPKVEVHIVASDAAPTGVGEPGVPPLAPAVVNAIEAATGREITGLPIGDQLTGRA